MYIYILAYCMAYLSVENIKLLEGQPLFSFKFPGLRCGSCLNIRLTFHEFSTLYLDPAHI